MSKIIKNSHGTVVNENGIKEAAPVRKPPANKNISKKDQKMSSQRHKHTATLSHAIAYSNAEKHSNDCAKRDYTTYTLATHVHNSYTAYKTFQAL